ncbi:hypothetical protein [Methylobacterium iners]|uniref:hypothetical protein n=1 Tax=Methylobacterium iners TaxID=418707 RepID=UPI001EE2DEC5|nr:hypothetical protein [Methylobacterium iners]
MITNSEQFRATLAFDTPSPNLSPTVAALWWAGKGEWDRAHVLVQEEPGADAAWVHAYLHRAEGDAENAAYWYRLARRPAADASLDEEWAAIADALLVTA